MKRRQTRVPRQSLIVDERNLAVSPSTIRKLPRGSGVIVLLRDRSPGERRRVLQILRRRTAAKRLAVVDEAAGDAVRVHDLAELRGALLANRGLILLSPLFPTRSHPECAPLPRMRAAAYARLASGKLIALGGMNERRFAQIERLGFRAWAGIDAFRT
jgi:thiamine-phosphate pyrophosphorylase